MDSGRLPDDRSFTYSLVIRALVRPFGSLWALVWWQSLAGVVTSAIAYHLLRTRLGASRAMATLAGCVLAIEPAQLYYERMVLAESFGLVAFALFCASAAAYLVSGRLWWLPVIAVVGLLSATLRLNYVPVVLVISAGVPLLRLFAVSRPSWVGVATHTAVAVVLVAATHGTFQRWVAMIFGSPPGYIARTGFMQLGLVMPLVTPDHLERVGLSRDLGEQLRFPIADPDARMPHQWAAGGFVRTLRERGIAIEPVARPLASMALADDPLGLLRMGVHTVGNYFRPHGIAHALDNDLGRRVIPNDILWTLREIWHYDADGVWVRTTPISWYFEKGTWWLVGCLFVLVPLAMVNAGAHWRSPARPQVLLLTMVSVGLVLAHVLFVPVAFYRYLHPLPFFVVINVALIVDTFRRD